MEAAPSGSIRRDCTEPDYRRTTKDSHRPDRVMGLLTTAQSLGRVCSPSVEPLGRRPTPNPGPRCRDGESAPRSSRPGRVRSATGLRRALGHRVLVAPGSPAACIPARNAAVASAQRSAPGRGSALLAALADRAVSHSARVGKRSTAARLRPHAAQNIPTPGGSPQNAQTRTSLSMPRWCQPAGARAPLRGLVCPARSPRPRLAAGPRRKGAVCGASLHVSFTTASDARGAAGRCSCGRRRLAQSGRRTPTSSRWSSRSRGSS
jgi:hypothetical protein